MSEPSITKAPSILDDLVWKPAPSHGPVRIPMIIPDQRWKEVYDDIFRVMAAVDIAGNEPAK